MMPYIVKTNYNHHPGPNWSTFVPVEPDTLEFNPAGSSYDYSQAKQGVVIDMSPLHHVFKAQFDHELVDSAKEDFMLTYDGPIVSDDFMKMIERIEPSHHQFKQVRLCDYWGQPFEDTAFYLMNIVGLIKNANMNWDEHRLPFQFFRDQQFGQLMRFESGSEFYASDRFAEAWIDLCGSESQVVFFQIPEPQARF
jgi:hypothetical protein